MSADRDSVERLIAKCPRCPRHSDGTVAWECIRCVTIRALLARCEAAEAKAAHPYREGDS